MKLLTVQFSLVSYYILHTKVNAAATEDHDFQILYTVPIASVHATCLAYFLFLMWSYLLQNMHCEAHHYAAVNPCTCSPGFRYCVLFRHPEGSVKLRNRDFVLRFSHLMLCAGRKKCISCCNALSSKIHCSHYSREMYIGL
jgi:hypothetical protein